MSVTRAIRKARKAHRCDGCGGRINPGESYLTHTALAGDEFGYHEYGDGTQPGRTKECAGCATRYDRGHLLASTETIEAVPDEAASSIPKENQ